MTTWVLLRIDNPEEAQRLVEDMREYPDHDLLTPTLENNVHAVLVDVITADGTQPATEPAAQTRNALDDAHAGVTSGLGELDRIRDTVTEALGPNDRAAIAVEQARERLQLAHDVIEKKLGIAPISFDIDLVTYDIVRSAQQPGHSNAYTVLCDGKRVVMFTLDGYGSPTPDDLIIHARSAVEAIERARGGRP